MTRKRCTFWIDPEQLAALKHVQERDGVQQSEQIRRALAAWLRARGVPVKPERKRAVTRRRP